MKTLYRLGPIGSAALILAIDIAIGIAVYLAW